MTDSKTYTPVQIAAIEAAFEACAKGEKLNNDDAKRLTDSEVFSNKNLDEVRGKIVSLGYYKAAKKVAVGSGGVVTKRKMEYVQAIETLTNNEKGSLASFEKGSKPQLEMLSNSLVKQSDRFNAELLGDEKTQETKQGILKSIADIGGFEVTELSSLMRVDVDTLNLIAGIDA